MMLIEINIFLVLSIGLVIFILALLAAFLLLKNKVDLYKNQAVKDGESIFLLQNQLSEKEKVIIDLNKAVSSKDTEISYLSEKITEQKKEIEEINNKLKIEFKNLANEIMEEKSRKFTQQNKENLDLILKPLNDKIKDFEKKVEEVYDKEAQQRFSLKEEVKRLAELNQQVSKEANALTRALKGESKTQGNWGEVILENILEKSGLVKDREYFIQESHVTEDGRRLQPDVIVHYPEGRSIIIDSKVSLTAYERYTSAETDEDKELALKEHLVSVKNHVNELQSKKYQDIYDIKTLDFVMMFLPVEPAYLLAISTDQDLWNFAYTRRILLISPTNLIAALKMIESMWRQEYQNRHAQEIAQKSGDLYDKFVDLVSDIQDIGNKLQATRKSWDAAMNKLSEGKGNLLKRTQDIKDLGIKNKKQLPQSLIDKAVNE